MGYDPRPRWTARQVNFLIENCYKMKDEEIAYALGKSLKSIRRKRERLEMHKRCGRGIVAPAYEAELDDKPDLT